MKALLTPPEGKSGFFHGTSLVGGVDFIIADPNSPEIATALARQRLEPVHNDISFPDDATTAGFNEILVACMATDSVEKTKDRAQFNKNRVRMAAEAYLSELAVDVTPKSKKA